MRNLKQSVKARSFEFQISDFEFACCFKGAIMNPDFVTMGRDKCFHLVSLEEKRVKKILVAKEFESELVDFLQMAKEKGLNLQYMPYKTMNRITHSKEHDGVMIETYPKHYIQVEDMLAYAKERNENPFLIVLDNVQDPHNLGAVLRTAEGAGVHGVIIPKSNAANVTQTVDKVSTGATEYVPIARVVNINNILNDLKEYGVWIVGVEVDGSKPYFNADLKLPIALVLGSEGEGMRKSIKEKCDFMVNIPMRGEITSLNVSVSAGVVMYETLRQRFFDKK